MLPQVSHEELDSALQNHLQAQSSAGTPIRVRTQPLREQMPHLLYEAYLAIEILRHLVVMARLEAQRPDADLPANVLAEADDRLSDLLPAVCLAHINLVEQREFAVKFQAEAERED